MYCMYRSIRTYSMTLRSLESVVRRSISAIIERLALRVAQNILDLAVQSYQQAATGRRRAAGSAQNPHVSRRRAPMQCEGCNRIAPAGGRPARLNAMLMVFSVTPLMSDSRGWVGRGEVNEDESCREYCSR